jgi:hypothetical protein
VPPRAGEAGVWLALPVTIALLLLLVTGIAWPPGLGDALGRAAAIVAR